MPTLNQLVPGQSATVESVQGDDAVAMRLMEMGLFAGETVTMRGVAPLGDPKEFEVCGCLVSLRRLEADRVTILLTE